MRSQLDVPLASRIGCSSLNGLQIAPPPFTSKQSIAVQSLSCALSLSLLLGSVLPFGSSPSSHWMTSTKSIVCRSSCARVSLAGACAPDEPKRLIRRAAWLIKTANSISLALQLLLHVAAPFNSWHWWRLSKLAACHCHCNWQARRHTRAALRASYDEAQLLFQLQPPPPPPLLGRLFVLNLACLLVWLMPEVERPLIKCLLSRSCALCWP